MDHSRRQFLAQLGAVGAGAMLSGHVIGQTQNTNPRRIDVHNHFGSPLFVQTLIERSVRPRLPGFTSWYALDTFRTYTPERCIEDMDRGGVEVSVVSNTSVGVWFGDLAETRRLARDANEYAAAKLVGAYKGRFGLFAQLPLPDIDASLKEIEYAFDTLKADGVGLTTSIGNRYLGDPFFAPVFEELNRRNAVVYTHPIDAPCCQDLQPGINAPTIEYNTDTSRCILSFLVNGTATKNPNLKFIFSHAGGTLTSLAGRFLGGQTAADVLARPPEPDSRLWHLRRFFYDTAQSANPVNMQALKALVGSSQIAYGSDWFGSPSGIQRLSVAQALQKCGFTPEELRGIDRQNILRILPQFA